MESSITEPPLEGGSVPRRALNAACVWFAVAGGFVMLAFMLVSVGSIVSRVFVGSPLLGDFELTERGSAIAVFAMLPYCHLRGGHVVVDMFIVMFPDGFRRVLGVVIEIVFAIVSALMAWRLALGGYDQYQYHDVSMMLQIPTWWIFVPVVASMILLALVCISRAMAAVRKGAR